MSLKEQFGDIKYCVLQGSPDRTKDLALYLSKEWKIDFNGEPIGKTERYSMYKVGHVLLLSHGIGMASLSIVLNEVYKLLHYAGCLSSCIFLRCGTCGGLGVEEGTVAITKAGVNTHFEAFYNQSVLGRDIAYPAIGDATVISRLETICKTHQIPYCIGNTMSCDGFYEDQGRIDGFFCDYQEQDKLNFLQKAYESGIRNIEMESSLFLATAKRANVQAGVICTVIVNRLHGDQVNSTHAQLEQYMMNSWDVVKYLCE